MIDYVTYIIFKDLPKDKEEEVRQWARKQYRDDYWHIRTGVMDEVYGGEFCVVTNYHYHRMRLPLYIYQLYNKYRNHAKIKVEIWSDYDAKPNELYGLSEVIESEDDWKEFLDEYPDEDTINRHFDEWWQSQKELQIAFVNGLKAVDEIKSN